MEVLGFLTEQSQVPKRITINNQPDGKDLDTAIDQYIRNNIETIIELIFASASNETIQHIVNGVLDNLGGKFAKDMYIVSDGTDLRTREPIRFFNVIITNTRNDFKGSEVGQLIYDFSTGRQYTWTLTEQHPEGEWVEGAYIDFNVLLNYSLFYCEPTKKLWYFKNKKIIPLDLEVTKEPTPDEHTEPGTSTDELTKTETQHDSHTGHKH